MHFNGPQTKFIRDSLYKHPVVPTQNPYCSKLNKIEEKSYFMNPLGMKMNEFMLPQYAWTFSDRF